MASTANLSSGSLPRHQRPRGFKIDCFNKLLFYLFSSKHDGNTSFPQQKPPQRTSRRRAAGTTTVLGTGTAAPPAASTQSPTIIVTSTRPHTAPASTPNDMPHGAHHAPDLPLDIVLQEDVVVIRGTGTDYEPATVRGIVRLALQEDTDIKALLIRCTGKSRIAISRDGIHSQPHTIIHYLKETELLEGDKSHPHTLKAGRHEFPFTYELNAHTPASILANFGMAAIEYRLRAIAVRPSSFATNFTVSKELGVIRSFSNEALEFQQTVEIENVWPEKVQYAVILPHKAWAAGDQISAVLKFTPLTKGVKVVNIRMGLQEKVKTVWRSTTHEEVRVVCSKKEWLRPSSRRSSSSSPSPEPVSAGATATNAEGDATQMHGGNSSGGGGASSGGGGRRGTSSFFRRVGSRVQSRENLLGIFRTRTGGEDSPPLPSSANMPTSTLTSTPTPPEQPPVASNQDPRQRRSQSPSQARERVPSPDGTTYEDGDVEIVLRLRIPEDATPSHNIGPLFVSHRVKWDVLISNLDGHYSELRCSLPIHLLAKEVLDETLAATNATRTALLGEGHGAQQVQEVVLPAYHDHIRDRVALVELPEHALAVNPLNATAASMPTTPEEEGEPLVPLSSSYGASSTMARPSAHSDVPRVSSMPDASERGRLGRQGASRAPTGTVEPPSSELYLSLGRRPDPPTSTTSPESGSHPPSQSSSRASSPERSGDHPSGKSSRHGFSLKPFTMFKSKASSTPSSSNPGSRPGSRPGSSKGRSGSQQRHRSTFSHSSSGLSVPSSPEPLPPPPIPIPAGMPMPRSRNYLSASNSPTSTQTSAVSTAPSDYYYYDTVPDYAFAAQCFLGGGITPLSSFRGLPSYDQAQRSRAGSPQTTTVGTVDSAESSGSALAMSSSRRRSGSGNAGRRSPTTRRSNEQEQRRPSQIPE